MRPRTVRLVDIGLDEHFDTSMSFVQATLRNINAHRLDDPMAEIELVRSRDELTIVMALTAHADVVHVMAHGGKVEGPTLSSDDGRTVLALDRLAGDVAENGRGIRTSTVFADGCRTGTKPWQDALADCLHGPITYIATTASIGWHESTVFTAMFYGVLFRNKGAGVPAAAASAQAATLAAQAYGDLLGKKSPTRRSPSSRVPGRGRT